MMSKKDDLRSFAIYSRKSKFTGKGESVENQVEMCRQYIRAQFGDVTDDQISIYEDEGFSGGNLQRPQFQKMMSDAKRKKFSAIVVYRLDRISRNVNDFSSLIKELDYLGISFISVRDAFDTQNSMGRAMMYISSVFAQLERETIAERIRDNMHELAKTGRWLGGTTPTGYTSESVSSVTIDGKQKKACKLRLIPEEASLVTLIYDKYLETGSLTMVDAFLLENRYVTKRGNQFTRFAIRNILANPVYMIADTDAYTYLTENDADLFSSEQEFDGIHGIMAYNRTLQTDGRATKIKPMDEWIVSIGQHEGIISGAKWVQVQKRLNLNKSKNYHRPRSHVALLSGLLYCGHCGDYMRPKLYNNKLPTGDLSYAYLCTTKERSKGSCCKIKNPNGNLLDARILEEIKKMGSTGSEFIRQLEKGKKDLLGDRQNYSSELDRLKEQLRSTEQEIGGLIQSLTKAAGSGAEEYIIREIDTRHNTITALTERIHELESISEQHSLADMEFDILKDLLSNFSGTIDAMTLEEKRAAIRCVIRKIVWDGEDIHVYFFGNEGEMEIPVSTAVDNKKAAPGESVEPLCDNSK